MVDSVAVPFIQLGNKRCLTDKQLCEDEDLNAFVKRFSGSFEYNPTLRVWVFTESEQAHASA